MADIINARLDKRNFEHLVAQMKAKSVDTKPIFAAIGNLAVKSVKQNFRDGGRPNTWVKSKKEKGKTLIGTGALMKGIHYKLDDNGVTVMTTKLPYAHILHFGGTTKPTEIRPKNKRALCFVMGGTKVFYGKVNHPGSKIPARPYMLLQDEDISAIENMMIAHLTENVK